MSIKMTYKQGKKLREKLQENRKAKMSRRSQNVETKPTCQTDQDLTAKQNNTAPSYKFIKEINSPPCDLCAPL